MKKSIFILFIFGIFSAQAQNLWFGKIINKASLEPISGAVIRFGENEYALSDAQGRFKIKSSDNGTISHHIILPTGHLPEDWHYGQKITFTMTPLRQPIPSDCKAQVVASIALITEEPRLLPFK